MRNALPATLHDRHSAALTAARHIHPPTLQPPRHLRRFSHLGEELPTDDQEVLAGL